MVMPGKHGRVLRYWQTDFAEELNYFYCRFQQSSHSTERKALMDELSIKSLSAAAVVIQREDVEKAFKRVNSSKAPGPDNISGRLLNTCYRQLSGIFCELFNRSLAQHSVPAPLEVFHQLS